MKIALLHRYPKEMIAETNAAFPYLQAKGIDVLTFKKFDRINNFTKHLKSFFWIFYAPFLVAGKDYDIVYCDDSYPIYPILIRLVVKPTAKVILRLGDLHLMYYFKSPWYEFFHALEVVGWKMADKIICISDAMADYVSQESGRKVEVIYDPA